MTDDVFGESSSDKTLDFAGIDESYILGRKENNLVILYLDFLRKSCAQCSKEEMNKMLKIRNSKHDAKLCADSFVFLYEQFNGSRKDNDYTADIFCLQASLFFERVNILL